MHQRVSNQSGFFRAFGLCRYLEHKAQRNVAYGNLLQQFGDNRVPCAFGLFLRWQDNLDLLHTQCCLDFIFAAVDQRHRAQNPIELWVSDQVQSVHHFADQPARAQHFDLGVHLRGVTGQSANHTLQIDNAFLFGFQHDHSGRPKQRHCCHKGVITSCQDRQSGDQTNDPFAAPNSRKQLPQVDYIVVASRT